MRVPSVLAAAIVLTSTLALLPAVAATGWNSAMIVMDRPTYQLGQQATMTVTGTDSDANAADNNINVFVFDGAGNVARQYLNRNPGGAQGTGPWTQTFTLSGGASPGLWRVNVHDAASATQVGSTTFLVFASTGVISLEPSIYTKTNVFVPGETIKILIAGAAPNGQHTLNITFGLTTLQSGSVTTDSQGNAETSWLVPLDASDGPNTNGEGYMVTLSGAASDSEPFGVKLFRLIVGTERSAFVQGEIAKVHYLAARLKDNAPAPDGWIGEWQLIRQSPPFNTARSGTFSAAAGSFDVSLDSVELASYILRVHYNSTATDPKNFDTDVRTLTVGPLGVVITSPANYSTYDVGATVNVQVTAGVGSIGVTGIPGVVVDIRVLRDGSVAPEYGAAGLVTGSNGRAGHAFVVGQNEKEGQQLQIEAKATKGASTATRWVMIRVSKTAFPGLNITVETDKSEYLSGEEMKITVRGAVEVAPTRYNYIFMITGGTGTLLIKDQANNVLSYKIPDDFEGTITVTVSVADGNGNSTTGAAQVSAYWARLLVNADRLTYDAEDTINVNFVLIARAGADPKYFYEVRDQAGALIKSDTPQGSSFSFQIPKVASKSYTVRVSAVTKGHLVTGAVILNQIVGMKLRTWVESASSLASGAFQPGERVKIGFEFVALGGIAPPDVFQIDYSTYGELDRRSYLGGDSRGTLDYVVPGDAGDGVAIISFSGRAGTYFVGDTLVLPVDAQANPLDLRVGGGISLFHVIIFLILLILLLWLIIRNKDKVRGALGRRGGGGGGGGGGLFRRKKGATPAQPPSAYQQPPTEQYPQQQYPQQQYQQPAHQWQPQPQQSEGAQFQQYHPVQGQAQPRRGESYIPPPGD